MDESAREPGFYWLKIDDEWQPAKFDGKRWWTLRTSGLVHECSEFGPRIRTTDEIRAQLKDTTSDSVKYVAGYGEALKWVMGEEEFVYRPSRKALAEPKPVESLLPVKRA